MHSWHQHQTSDLIMSVNRKHIQAALAKGFLRVEFRMIGRSLRRRHRMSKNFPGPNLSSVAFAAYRSGQLLEDHELGKSFDFSNRHGIGFTTIVSPEGSPDWTNDRSMVWNAVQKKDTRINSQLARECLLSLPNELSAEAAIQLVLEYVNECFVSIGMIADIAIHFPSKELGDENLHAHIMLTTRVIESDGFGLKVREWDDHSNVEHWRSSISNLTNLYLEREGLELRVSHKSRARLEREQGQHFDYSVQYDSLDIELEPNLELSHEIDSPLLDELQQNENLEREHRGDSEIKLEKRDTSLQTDLANDSNLGETEFVHDENEAEFHQFRQEVLSLVAPKCRYELTVHQRLTQLARLEGDLEDRLTRIEAVMVSHSDPIYRERLKLQAELEKSFFLQHSNRLKFDIHAKTEKVHDTAQILNYRREAAFAGKSYKSYLCEWCRRSIHDSNYFVIDTKLTKLIERHRSHDRERWADFEERALKSDWGEPRRAQEAKILQQKLDKELRINLERCLELKRGLELNR